MERPSVRLMMHVAITFTEFLQYLNRDVQRLRHYDLSRISHDPLHPIVGNLQAIKNAVHDII